MTESYIHGVARVALITPTSEILLIKRVPRDAFRGGKWDLPGGTINEGETALDAIVREVIEETNIELDPDDLQVKFENQDRPGDPIGNHPMTMRRSLYYVLLTDKPTVTLDPLEHTNKLWTPIQEASTILDHHVYEQALGELAVELIA